MNSRTERQTKYEAYMMAHIEKGSTVQVIPAYSMDTRSRSNYDEYTGLEYVVEEIRGRDILIRNEKNEVWMTVGRLVFL